MTRFGSHVDVKMLCGTVIRDGETFKEVERAKSSDQHGNRTVSDSFDVYTATPTPSMTGTASPQTTLVSLRFFSCFSMDCNFGQPEQA